MSAILFGSISTIADTSELQRQAFNEAFAEHGLDWAWSREEYAALLQGSGGEQRIAEQARATGEDVDAAAVHRTKSERFQRHLAAGAIQPRAGVLETIKEGRAAGFKIGLVTTTSQENVTALVDALGEGLDFDVVVDASDVSAPKPDGAAYAFALEALGEPAAACVAIEDNLGGVAAAQAAGVRCAAFPNENTAGHDFAAADQRVQRLSLAELRPLLPDAA